VVAGKKPLSKKLNRITEWWNNCESSTGRFEGNKES